ncbi:N-formylglutamate amidohydrolase [Sphingomonas sp. H39-1-10]|uniref:N-formylglutamate amidohydrolase n=1 Tax=Sphingomonas pollutisoli TaxID=3030829 RepID=UPI0023BA0FC0|nr:N-formylglutamate amidohydrolase [Sphingomonas pollutisoli]MDF0490889.1 N-formylglutamate amidohydrolase [Sphingomonas pollutisoli]
MAQPLPSFDLYDADAPASPVVLSVPHAGRDYPLTMRAALRVPPATLVALEDRHADTLALGARGDEAMIVQRRARAWIDLNRSEQERDPAIDTGVSLKSLPAATAKLRGGLGLIPRRTASTGDIWRRKLDGEEVTARIVRDYRPYHAALRGLLAAARERFGVAVLLDVHSMPSLGAGQACLVIGDRFGRAAPSRMIARIEAEATAAGVPVALNVPYAGGHIIDTHADPARHIFAVQLEFDRALYLDGALDRPGDGLIATTALLRRIITAVADEALPGPAAIAAE